MAQFWRKRGKAGWGGSVSGETFSFFLIKELSVLNPSFSLHSAWDTDMILGE